MLLVITLQVIKLLKIATAFHKPWHLLKQEKNLGKNYEANKKEVTNCAIN